MVAKTNGRGHADDPGVLTEAGDGEFAIKGEGDQIETIRYDQVLSARTVFRWERAPKPGQARRQP